MKGRTVSSEYMKLQIEHDGRDIHIYLHGTEIPELKRSIDVYTPFLKNSICDAINSVYGVGVRGRQSKKKLLDVLIDNKLIVPKNKIGSVNSKDYALNEEFKNLLTELLSDI